MKTLTAKQQLQYAAATTCELCHRSYTMKNKKTKHHCHLADITSVHTSIHAFLKLKWKKMSQLRSNCRNEAEIGKKKANQVFQWDIQKIHQKGRRRCRRQRRSEHRWLYDDRRFMHDPCHFSQFEGVRLAFNYAVRYLCVHSQLNRCHSYHFGEIFKFPNRQSSLRRQFAIFHRLRRHAGSKFGCGWQR